MRAEAAVATVPAAVPASSTLPAALSLRGVVRRFGERTVLDGVELSLAQGAVAWLGGPNGSGKTTLLRIAAGILRPQQGSVALGGIDPERDRRAFHRRLGFLPAGDRGLYARLTVLQNLEFWAGIALTPPRGRPALLEAAINRFSLGELAGQRVDRLSMGQRQRVRLAMTFLHQPDVVLLDEPHTSLDDDALALLEGALTALRASGGSALWCSPSRAHAVLRADDEYCIERGRLVRL